MKLHTILFLSALLFPPLIIAQELPATVICHLGAYDMADGFALVIQPSDADNLRYRYFNGVSGKLFPATNGQYETGSDWSSRYPSEKMIIE